MHFRALWQDLQLMSGIKPLVVCVSAMMLSPSTANATELPVNQCVDGGLSSSSPEPTGGQAGNQSFTPPTPNVAKAKLQQTTPFSLGQVDPATGAFTVSNEDIVVGQGAFPASLAVTRTFNSRRMLASGRPVYRAGANTFLAFGIGSNHNLDMRFQISDIYFGSERFGTAVLALGPETVTFQQCANGEYRNFKRDGSRLFADSSLHQNGLRYESRDGHILYFQRAGAGAGNCNRSTRSPFPCGYLRRWIAPNGDRADFVYQEYYSHPDGQSRVGGNDTRAMTGYGTTNECHITTKGINDCRSVNKPYFVTYTQIWSPITSQAVYEMRLIEVSNSRGYKLTFDYVDSTTNDGGYCPGMSGGQLVCVTPEQNAGMLRNRVSKISKWRSTQGAYIKLGEVNYGYLAQNGYSGDFLTSFANEAQVVTKISPSAVYLPGDASPWVTVQYVQTKGDYYFFHADEVSSSLDYERQYTYYQRAQALNFADGRTVTYTPQFAGRWKPDVYSNWLWEEFIKQMTVSDAAGSTTYHFLDGSGDDHHGPSRIVDANGRARLIEYNALGTIMKEIEPELNSISYTYDQRGNLVTRTIDPKPGSGLPVVTELATYTGSPSTPANSCANQKICNRQLWSEDSRAGRTDYEWDASTGLPTRSRGPVLPDGQRPEQSFAYAGFAGSDGAAMVLPVSATTTISSGTVTTDSFEYTSDSHRHLKGSVQSSGGSAQRSCFGYDASGRRISETSPMANLAACP